MTSVARTTPQGKEKRKKKHSAKWKNEELSNKSLWLHKDPTHRILAGVYFFIIASTFLGLRKTKREIE